MHSLVAVCVQQVKCNWQDQQSSRAGGQQGRKTAGQEGRRAAGQEDSRAAGQQGRRVADLLRLQLAQDVDGCVGGQPPQGLPLTVQMHFLRWLWAHNACIAV